MAVRKRKNGGWMIDVVLWKGGERVRIRKTAGVKTKQEALEIERKERQKLKLNPVRTSSEIPLFSAFAKEFLDTYAAVENKHSERRSKEMILRYHLVPAFGKMRLDAITARHVDAYKAEKLASGLAPKTVNNQLIVLSRALRVAVEWGRLSTALRIRLLKAKAPDFRFFSFDEAARLLAASDPTWRPMVLFAVRTGMRLGELMALRWSDIDMNAGRVVVRRSVYLGVIDTPKGGRSREIPLSDQVLDVLKTLKRRGEYVFCQPNGAMLTMDYCRYPLRRFCRMAGLPEAGWHALRHTFASHLVMRGVPLKAVQDLMGHATFEVTLRYSHLSPHVTRDAVKLLDQSDNANAVTH